MSKRKRTDFEEGVQSASGTAYNGQPTPAQGISYDDPQSPPRYIAEDSSMQAGPSKRQTPCHSGSEPQPSLQTSRRQVSYVDEAEAAPEGPYSYVAEKRQQIYYSGKDADTDGSKQVQKRPRQDQKRCKPKVDDRFGQLGAFPEPEREGSGKNRPGGDHAEKGGAGNAAAEDGESEEDRAAWEYLRAVREEAQGLPGVLHAGAVKANQSEEATAEQGVPGGEEGLGQGDETWDEDVDDGDQDGLYFEDGVCYAAPQTPLPEKTATAQDLYYQVLCRRFESHRARIRSLGQAGLPAKPPHGKNKLGLKQLLSTKDLHKAQNLRNGRPSLLSFAAPSLHFLAGLNNESALGLISTLDGDIDEAIGKQKNLPENIAAWVWCLLGRLSDKGSLWSEEIVIIRDLAKRAGWALAALKIGNMQHHAGSDQEMVSDKRADTTNAAAPEGTAASIDADMEDGEIDEQLVGAVVDKQSHVTDAVPNQNTMATLHAIITIAGEFYGQRDLLDARLPWFE